MRRAKRWRYYCDYCGKVGGSRRHMERHETACTANPNRVCGMCAAANIEQAPLSQIIGAIEGVRWPVAIERMRAVAGGDEIEGGCPACLLAAIRQAPSLCYIAVEFYFKKERDRFWEIVNDARG